MKKCDAKWKKVTLLIRMRSTYCIRLALSQESGFSGFVGKGGGSLNVHDSGESFQSRCQEVVQDHAVCSGPALRVTVLYNTGLEWTRADETNQRGRLRIVKGGNVSGTGEESRVRGRTRKVKTGRRGGGYDVTSQVSRQ